MPAVPSAILLRLARLGFVGVGQLFFFLLQQQYNKKTAEAVVNQTSSPILQLRQAIAQQSARIAIAEKNVSGGGNKMDRLFSPHPCQPPRFACYGLFYRLLIQSLARNP